MKRDLAWGIVAVALLLGATLAVFQYEWSQGGGSGFRVSFVERDAAGPSAESLSGQGRVERKDLDVVARNVTRAAFVLAWTDDLGEADAFRLTVTSPQGIARAAEGASGRIEVVFEGLAARPEDARLLAASAKEAEGRVASEGTSSAAVGAWRAEVTLTSAPGVRVGGVEVQPDGENAWRLSSVLSVYEARVTQG